MTDLIDRLKAATVGSRELSDEILLATGWTTIERQYQWFDPSGVLHDGRDAYDRRLGPPRPSPSESIDAALTLQQENVVSITICDSPAGPTSTLLLDDGREIHGFPEPGCGNLAIVVCIAFLEAREADR